MQYKLTLNNFNFNAMGTVSALLMQQSTRAVAASLYTTIYVDIVIAPSHATIAASLYATIYVDIVIAPSHATIAASVYTTIYIGTIEALLQANIYMGTIEASSYVTTYNYKLENMYIYSEIKYDNLFYVRYIDNIIII